jgi:hypothetical protein
VKHTRPHRHTHLALSLVAAALALLLLAPSALAFETRAPLGSFGPDGTSATSFAGIGQLAFNQANDKLYADEVHGINAASDAIYAFDAPAHAPAGGAFPLSLSEGEAKSIAVDNTLGASAGNIYNIQFTRHVGAPRSKDLFGFNAAGVPLAGNFPVDLQVNQNGPADVAVDSAGTIWVADESDLKAIFKYDSAGNFLGKLSTASQGFPERLAFDSNDDLYVTMRDHSIWKYAKASSYTTRTNIILPGASISQLAIDGSTHTLYAAEREKGSVAAYDLEATPPLTPLYRFGVGVGDGGITVDESTHQVYASAGTKVKVFGAPADFPDASGTVQAASNVGLTEAELHATIDDNSALETRWFFQVSTDGGVTWANSCPQGAGGLTPGGQSGFAVSCIATHLQADTPYLFRVVTNKGPGSTDVNSSPLSFETETLPNAEATLEAATSVTATSAELHAKIDDKSFAPTNWRFQLSTGACTTWVNAGISGTTAGNQSAAPVSGTKTGLEPNTEYCFRLLTNKGAGFVDVPSGVLHFTTPTEAPLISSVGAVAITDTSAYLAAEINPRNDATSYLFKYGTSPGLLGSETPLTAIGAGGSPLVVAQPLSELSPGSDYYFKLFASNAAGEESESAELSFHTRATPLPPPDHRAYEQVSPVDKNFGDAGVRNSAVAWDGGAVMFQAVTGFGAPAGQIGFVATDYRSARTTVGWHTRWMGEPLCETDIGLSIGAVATPPLRGLSPNLNRAVIKHAEGGSCPLPPLDPAAPLPGENLYLGDYTTSPVPYDLLTTQDPDGEYRGGSEDFNHVVYTSKVQQTPDALAGNFDKVFDWHAGALDLVSKDTSDNPFATSSAVLQPALNSVSASGDRIFFQNPGSPGSCLGNCELYLREDDSITYDVSESECTVSCGSSAPDSFRWATPTGDRVLLSSSAKLTDEDTSATGGDLYLWSKGPDPAHEANLTLLSKDSEAADGTAADVQGVLGMSDDGDTVYFVASGQIVSGAPTAAGPKLYRWQSNGGSPILDYLATLASVGAEGESDLLNWAASFEGETRPPSRLVAAEGKYLLLHTVIRLDPAADHDSSEDVYRWDQQSGWDCLSCQPPGAPSAGSSTLQSLPKTGSACCALGNVMSDDGQRVFFTSKDALVPTDTNGKADVYEWHDGAVNLISTGAGTTDARLLGVSRSGKDVFFTTFERLVGWDVDGNSDIYDARVGGGFPEPPPSGAICEAEGCRGAGTSAPTTAGPGTPNFIGPGNPTAKHHKPKPKSKHHKKHHKHHQRRANHNRRAVR